MTDADQNQGCWPLQSFAVGVGVAAAAAALLAGCSLVQPDGYPLSSTVQDCVAPKSKFIDSWGCVQARFASGQMGDPDKRVSSFMKLGDDLAGQVANKALSDAEAKTRLSAGAADLDKM